MEIGQFGLFNWTPVIALIFDLCLVYKLIILIYFRTSE